MLLTSRLPLFSEVVMQHEFDNLPTEQQQPYLDWAEHLIQKGYVLEDDVRKVAQKIYEKKALDNPK